MMDYSDVDRMVERLRFMAQIERHTDPILEKHGERAGELVNEYAPKRTRPRNPGQPYTQRKPGVVTFPPYLVGEYKGSSTRGPNRRFLKSAVNDVRGPLRKDLAALVERMMRG